MTKDGVPRATGPLQVRQCPEAHSRSTQTLLYSQANAVSNAGNKQVHTEQTVRKDLLRMTRL